MSPRSVARFAAIQATFQCLLRPSLAMTCVIEEFVSQRFQEKKYALFNETEHSVDCDLFCLIVKGVDAHQEELDDFIASALPTGWHVNKLENSTRCILRCAVFELKYCLQTPHEVILDEYITAAHGFLLEKGPAFVNGVLDKIYKCIRHSQADF